MLNQVIVRMRGGLGNQLSQLASGLQYSGCIMQRITLDPLYLILDWQRRDELSRRSGLKVRYGSSLMLCKSTSVVVNTLCDNIDKEVQNIVIDGSHTMEMWSESAISQTKQIVEGISTNYASKINLGPEIGKYKVALHIRGGDYVSSAKTSNKYGGICDDEYYRAALDAVGSYGSDVKYYIFSNDAMLAQRLCRNVNIAPSMCSYGKDVPYYKSKILRNIGVIRKYNIESTAWHDLLWMRSMDAIIIANSTMSWWAAKLCKDDACIVCPSRWTTNDMELNDKYIKTRPSSWIVVD